MKKDIKMIFGEMLNKDNVGMTLALTIKLIAVVGGTIVLLAMAYVVH